MNTYNPKNDFDQLGRYVERRERCRAMQFRDADQAVVISRLLNAEKYTLHRDHAKNQLSLKLSLGDEGGEVVIHKGDFLKVERDIVSTWMERFVVVPRHEFQDRFEPDISEM